MFDNPGVRRDNAAFWYVGLKGGGSAASRKCWKAVDMAGRSFDLEPQDVPQVDTGYRTIKTQIPVPESIPILESLRAAEPVSMQGQPPVVWDHAEGFSVYDRWGNRWIDFSSGVLVTSAGHARKEIVDAIVGQAQHHLVHNYCFPSEMRAKLASRLVAVAPDGLDKVFLLTTGSEATECAFKLARTHGQSVGGKKKIAMVSFENSFHGRTLAAQMMGGSPELKEWIVNLDRDIVQVPFPDGFRCEDTSFDLFLSSLQEKGFTPDRIAGVITETYQGGGASFAPPEYVQKLRAWCDEHDIVLVMDEVQAGFGRTGKHMFGFQHYGITPDLVCCGKGISSGMPISAVIGRQALMDQYPPGSMTSTHTGNPICAAAALANLDIIEKDGLVELAERNGDVLYGELDKVRAKHSDVCGALHGKGMVAGLHMVKPGGKEPDGDLAFDIVKSCMNQGVLMFSPVGTGGATVKIAPPIIIEEDAIREAVGVIEDSIAKVLAG